MSVPGFKPFFSRSKGVALSGTVLIELIRAVHDKGALFRFRATGFSMLPAIEDGDRVLIEPLGGSEPRVGDIAAFIQPATGGLAIHRIIDKNGDAFLLKGDNAVESDGYVPRLNILGLVRVVERSGGWNRILLLLRKIRGRLHIMRGQGL